MVLLAFSKKINTHADCLRPEKTVTANVLLNIPSVTIDKFNIPTLSKDSKLSLHTKVSGYTRNFRDKPAQTEDFERTRKILNQCKKVILFLEKQEYRINFPLFFNLSMIDQALVAMIRAHSSEVQYCVLPNRTRRAIQGEESGWGKVWLVQSPIPASNTEDSNKNIGSLTIVRATQKVKSRRTVKKS